MCVELNVKMSHETDEDAVQVAVAYGFEFNLGDETVGIPIKKLEKLKAFIKSTISTGIITGRVLDTLCGKILHWSQLI